jgi:hypothetical protein
VFVPLWRVVAIVLAGILCFAVLVPMALARHNAPLAIVIAAVFVAYLIANVLIWQRMRPHV